MKILLIRDHKILIDDEDYDIISRFPWRIVKGRNTYYAVCRINGTQTSLHHLIIGKLEVDHIDLNGLNYQKNNLRLCSKSQNQANRPKQVGVYKSKFKGVSTTKDGKWRAYIKNIYLGRFDNEISTAIAYNSKAIEVFGTFARLNEVT